MANSIFMEGLDDENAVEQQAAPKKSIFMEGIDDQENVVEQKPQQATSNTYSPQDIKDILFKGTAGENSVFKDPTIQEQPQPTHPEHRGAWGSFMAGVEGMNRQFGRMAEGIFDLMTTGDLNKTVKQVQKDQEASLAKTQDIYPTATKVGEGIGAVGSAIAYGGVGGGLARKYAPELVSKGLAYAASHPFAATVGVGAGSNAALGYLDYADSQGERLKKGLVGGVAGGVLSGLGYGANKLLNRWLRPKEKALEELSMRVKADLGDDAAEKIPGLLRPAAALEDTRTPGQAVGGLTASKEAQLRATSKVQAQARTLERESSETTLQGVADAIEKIAPTGTKEVKSALYEELSKAKVGDDVVNTLKSNKILSKELDNLNLGAEVTEATSKLPDNSVAKWDIVKQEIDDKLFRDARALDPTSKKGLEAIRALKEARKKITDTLDPLVSSYAPARKEAQKLILRRRYEDLLIKKGAKAGKAGELDVDETFQTLFPNKETQKVFIHDVEAAGGNAQQAEELLTALEQLRQNPLKAIWKRPAEDSPLSIFYGNKIGFIQKLEDMLSGARYRKALLDLTFNGNKWADQVAKALSSPKKHESLLKLMVKVTSRGALRAGVLGATRGLIPKD